MKLMYFHGSRIYVFTYFFNVKLICESFPCLLYFYQCMVFLKDITTTLVKERNYESSINTSSAIGY